MILKNIFLLLFAFLSSCLEINDNISKPDTNPFFDLKTYFSSEVSRLSGINNVKKITSVNGNKEILNLDSLNIRTELKIFSDSDINRPAWTDKYLIDSLKNDSGQLLKLIYSTNDEKLKTKKIEIDFEDEAITQIIIEKNASSAISSMNQLLTYIPSKGYLIERQQDVTLGGKNEFKVEVIFED